MTTGSGLHSCPHTDPIHRAEPHQALLSIPLLIFTEHKAPNVLGAALGRGSGSHWAPGRDLPLQRSQSLAPAQDLRTAPPPPHLCPCAGSARSSIPRTLLSRVSSFLSLFPPCPFFPLPSLPTSLLHLSPSSLLPFSLPPPSAKDGTQSLTHAKDPPNPELYPSPKSLFPSQLKGDLYMISVGSMRRSP